MLLAAAVAGRLPRVAGSRSESYECHEQNRNRVVSKRENLLPLRECFSINQIVLFACQAEILPLEDFFCLAGILLTLFNLEHFSMGSCSGLFVKMCLLL